MISASRVRRSALALSWTHHGTNLVSRGNVQVAPRSSRWPRSCYSRPMGGPRAALSIIGPQGRPDCYMSGRKVMRCAHTNRRLSAETEIRKRGE